jgi:hypothetical protein
VTPLAEEYLDNIGTHIGDLCADHLGDADACREAVYDFTRDYISDTLSCGADEDQRSVDFAAREIAEYYYGKEEDESCG